MFSQVKKWKDEGIMPKRVISKIKKRDVTSGVSVQEAVDAYLDTTHVKQLSERTREEYQHELKVFAIWCSEHAIMQSKKGWIAVDIDEDSDYGPVMLDRVNDQAVHCFIEHVKLNHKPNKAGRDEISTYTLAGYVRVIKGFLNWCLLDEEYGRQLQAITIQRIKKPPIIETIIETFSTEQINDMFEACQNEESEHLQLRDEAILGILLDAGLRAKELVTLTIGNICTDHRDPHVRVLGKGNKWGEVGLGERSRKSVAKYIRMFREPTIEYELEQDYPNLNTKQIKQLVQTAMPKSLVFVNRYGNAITTSGLYQIVERLGEWAHIQGVRCSPHTFRHTFARLFMTNDLAHNGGDIYRLSKLLRHSSVKVTEEYLKSLKQSEARRGQKSVLDNLR